jgi:outer membrane receptor protein involved in Fe transport
MPTSTLRALRWRPVVPVLSLIALLAASVRAGHAAPPEAPAAARDDSALEPLVTLTPFEVSTTKDYGYTATSSLAGGRLATDLDKTPAAVSVLTREFLEDIGAFNTQQALLWTTNGVGTTDTDVSAENDIGTQQTGMSTDARGTVSVRLRGIRDASITRDFFTLLNDADSFTTERIDISRGPNALIFGNASTGGVVNINSKRALLSATRRTMEFALSDHGGYRTSVDLNQRMGERGAVRIAGLWQDLDGWRDFSFDRRKGVFGAATLRVGASTQVRVQGEFGTRNKNSPVTYLADGMSTWNGTFTQANIVGSTAAQRTAAGVGVFPTAGNRAANNVIDLGNIAAGASNWTGAGFLTTVGLENAVWTRIPDELSASIGTPFLMSDAVAPLDGRRRYPVTPYYGFTNNIASRYISQRFRDGSVFVDHRFGPRLHAEFAANTQRLANPLWLPGTSNRVRIDLNQTLPSGAPNPNFLHAFGEDHVRVQSSVSTTRELRASLVYFLDTSFTRQRIGLVVSDSNQTDTRVIRRLVRVNGTTASLASSSNNLVFRSYLDRPGDYIPARDLEADYSFGPIAARFVSFNGSGVGFRGESGTRSAQIFGSGSWLRSERIHSVVGLRRDWYESEAFGQVYDPVTAVFTGNYTRSDSIDDTVDSPSLGAVVKLTPWLSAFANTSKSFVGAASQVLTVNGTLAPIRRGVGRDYGLKFNALDGRLTGSLGYYDTNEENTRKVIDSPFITTINELNLLARTGDPEIGVNASDTQDATATGWEFEVTANPTPRWAFVVNAGVPSTENKGAYGILRAYVAERRARWLAAGPDATQRASLDALEGELLANESGQPVIQVRDYTANAFTRYRFAQGVLRNVTVGGGINVQGRNFIGPKGTGGPPVYTESTYRVTGLVSYRRKVWGAQWDFRLNVSNLLDDSNFRIVGYRATGIPVNYRIDSPREVRLSTAVAF